MFVSDFLSRPTVNRRRMSVTIVHTNGLSLGTHNVLFISPYTNAPAYSQENPRSKLEGSSEDRQADRQTDRQTDRHSQRKII